ncbi:MAG: histidine--tRNA ligase [Candidatus Heimdallarchaeota archaeon]
MGSEGPPPRVRGTRDFLPDDWRRIQYIFDVWRRIAKRYGFEEIEMPVLERYELFARKSGEELSQQLFHFLDKSERRLCLRAETTPIIARMYIENERRLVKPLKWFCMSRLFRYEAPQKGRLREFFQLNVDVLGGGGNNATAEVIACGIDICREFKLTSKDFVMLLNNRKLLEGLVRQITDVNVLEVFGLIDKRSKLSADDFQNALLELGLSQSETEQIEVIAATKGSPIAILEQLKEMPLNKLALAGFEELKETCGILNEYHLLDYCAIDLSIVRGLAYYVGDVFEVFDIRGELRSVLGGGVYTTMYGEKPAPAVGFGFGDAVIGVLLEERQLFPPFESELDVYVVMIDPSVGPTAQRVLSQLRNLGLKVDIDLGSRKFRKQLQQADKRGARFAIIIGPKDVEADAVTIKDLQSGQQKTVPQAQLASYKWD